MLYAENKALEDQIKDMAMYMANTYELYLGKSCMNVTAVEELLRYMEEEQLGTVGDALNCYYRDHPMEQGKQTGIRK